MKQIKQIFWGNVEGKFSENEDMVKIDWNDGEVLTMQSNLFYNDWLPRVSKKVKVIYGDKK